MQKALVFLAFFVSFSFANDACLELCSACDGSTEEACLNVWQTCSCERLKQEAAAKDAAREASRQTFAQELLKTCEHDICSRDIFLKENEFLSLQKAKVRLTQKELRQKLVEARPYEDPATRVQPLTGRAGECSEICKSCPVSLDDTTPFAYTDPLCQKIDQTCSCIQYAENERDLALQRAQDSVRAIEEKIIRIDNASNIADSLLSSCTTKDTCVINITFENKTLQILDIYRKKKEEKIDNADAFVPIAVVPPTPVKQEEPVKADSAKNEPPQVAAPVQNAPNPLEDMKDAKETVPQPPKDPRIQGLLLGYTRLNTIQFPSIFEADMGFEISLGYFHRWYFFNDILALQIGVNGVYEYVEGDGILNNYGWGYLIDFDYFDWNYHAAVLEIPVSIRLGAPVIYLGGTFAIRKPIYEWMNADYGSSNGWCSGDSWQFKPAFNVGLGGRNFNFEFSFGTILQSGDAVGADTFFGASLNIGG